MYPYGVCVSDEDQLLFVTEFLNHRISVFQLDGAPGVLPKKAFVSGLHSHSASSTAQAPSSARSDPWGASVERCSSQRAYRSALTAIS